MHSKKIYWTIDIECHDIKKRNLYIDGKLKNGENCGLEHILQLANKFNIPVNCFLDIPEALVYGDQYITDIIDLIHKYGQKVYLHLHPDYITGDRNRSFLWEYNYEEKKEILRKGFELYKKFLGNSPTCFRIGRYGADEEMYLALNELGISVTDLSYGYNNPHMCHVDHNIIGTMNKAVLFHNQIILPNTRFCGFNLFRKQKALGLDFSETTLNEYKRVLSKSSLDSLVVTMHSWNFIKKYFFLKSYITWDKTQERRFVKMVNFASQNGFVFSDLDSCPPIVTKDSKDEYIDLCKTLKGKIMMIPNNFIRFFRIAALDKKYFVLYVSFFSACIALLVFIVLLLLI